MISSNFYTKKELLSILPEFIESIYKISKGLSVWEIKNITNRLSENLIYFFEYPYVEKYYRDTFYNYYSKKHISPHRDSIRISIFNSELDTLNYVSLPDNDIEKYYLGFLTLRPTSYRMLGHTFISPLALKEINFISCLTRKSSLVLGKKLSVTGFPFCSQDNEAITCAESTLINLFDYFATKYPEYKILLPSQINKILTVHSSQRQLPSKGLLTSDISYVLKKLGFGSKIYSTDNNDDSATHLDKKKFKELMYHYVESGIPLIASLSNKVHSHAVLIIGREKIDKEISFKKRFNFKSSNSKNDFSTAFKKLLIMDDNNAPYELVDYDKPIYDSEINDYYKFASFVVPLYSRVYLDAYEFEIGFFALIDSFSKHSGTKNIKFIDNKKNYITRFFLASSRSYKNYIGNLEQISEDMKMLILNKSMPKFIWVGEIIFGDIYNNKSIINSIIVMDATESGNANRLIFATNSEFLIFPPTNMPLPAELEENETITQFQIFNFATNKEIFYTFTNNLKGAHTRWQS